LLKESVGDRDEMPVVLHNQALNVLYKMVNSNIDVIQCADIEFITNDAISILDRTNSIKRLGMLLIENCICKSLLKQNNGDIVKRLEEHFVNLDENESKQILKLYKEFIKANKIENIKFLDEII
jgi:hypothetical protein